ncbi:MAG: circularly permuted type 2 ATP-grasp protein [Fimbriimonadaceae bacterium]|nr:circularly permuted type 2 ATP-grasp protein [Fimbriimonadaceae bacterium]
MVIGPQATPCELGQLAAAIRAHPEQYIAQELVRSSQHPTVSERCLVPRHVDLRPFIVQGDSIEVLPGGLTRVALREGSFVVNSSQDGGSKDTWVLRDVPGSPERAARAGRVEHGVVHRDAVLGPEAEAAREQQQQQQQQGGAAR